MNAMEVTGVRKSFGETLVLDGVDLRVAEGTIVALLGPNGAGKDHDRAPTRCPPACAGSPRTSRSRRSSRRCAAC